MIIDVVVKPGSRKFEARLEGGLLHVVLTERAEKNKANIELLKELSKLLGCPVRLISGATSKRKKLEIEISEAELHSFFKTNK
jgi:uncharacterized protein YggU (UPF0235/DUF167 family)